MFFFVIFSVPSRQVFDPQGQQRRVKGLLLEDEG